MTTCYFCWWSFDLCYSRSCAKAVSSTQTKAIALTKIIHIDSWMFLISSKCIPCCKEKCRLISHIDRLVHHTISMLYATFVPFSFHSFYLVLYHHFLKSVLKALLSFLDALLRVQFLTGHKRLSEKLKHSCKSFTAILQIAIILTKLFF